MWIFNQVPDVLCDSLMDAGWDSKITIGADILKCTIKRESMSFQYHIARSTLYVRFFYNRHRMVSPTVWEAIDQDVIPEMISVNCEMGEWRQTLEVGAGWSLHDLRQDIMIYLQDLDTNFVITIDDGQTVLKANRRAEKRILAGDLQPPRKLVLVSRSTSS